MSDTKEWPESVRRALADGGINLPGSGDPPPTSGKDTRIAYGARCLWWDSIHKVGNTGPFTVPRPFEPRGTGARFGDGNLRQAPGLPCCPKCRGLLLEVPTLDAWMDNVDKHEANGHPGYRAFLEWQRGKCFKTMPEAKAAYTAETGIALDWPEAT